MTDTHTRRAPRRKLPDSVRTQYYKTELCPWYSRTSGKVNSTCFEGENCKYAHSTEELRPRVDLTRTKLCPNFAQGCMKPDCRYAHSTDHLRSTSTFYKTKLCKNFAAGFCSLGDGCRHAHGEKELRNLSEPEWRGSDRSDESTRIPSDTRVRFSSVSTQEPVVEDELISLCSLELIQCYIRGLDVLGVPMYESSTSPWSDCWQLLLEGVQGRPVKPSSSLVPATLQAVLVAGGWVPG